ncbi:MAG: hypothetical protein ISS46_03010 [Candidatus Omnitrophica bacterium]|nr:hypothetical protein [Candidatus Omnitrophota bacterium]
MIRLREENGFSLVETIIAIVFIAIALVAMAAAFTNASSILQRSRHTLTAVGQLQKWVEFYRNSSFSTISAIPTGTNISLNVSNAPLQNPNLYLTVNTYDADGDSTNDSDIRKVSLRISWDERSGTITKKMVTLITENGINP